MSLRVVRSIGLVTVQDVGRAGHMHEGLAPGGALVLELLAAANRRAGNADQTAAIEVMGALTVRAETDLVVATDADGPRPLRAGEELTVVSDVRRVAYLALRGGIEAPVVLGSRSAQLSAGIGQLLRRDQRLTAGTAPVVSADVSDAFESEGPIQFLAGPDLDAFGAGALETLTSGVYTVLPDSNRVGTRLIGPVIPRSDRQEVTRPMVRGAIEVPRDGQPIVLGPEHPVTGGYPVIGVVANRDLGRLCALPAGAPVRFTIG